MSLAAAALVIGMTGTWSPCGFSMVETLGLAGERGRRFTVAAACAAFVPGAVVGGLATFGLLSGLGEAPTRRRPRRLPGGRRHRRRGRCGGGARAPDRPSDPPAAAGELAVDDAASDRRAALRGPPRARLHHLRPELRRLGAGGDQPRARERRGRAGDRRRVRNRARDPDRGGRTAGGSPVRTGLPAHHGGAPGALPALPAGRCGNPRARRRRAGDHHRHGRSNRGDERRGSVGGGQGDRVPEGERGGAASLGWTEPSASRTRPGARRPVRCGDQRRPGQGPQPFQAERPRPRSPPRTPRRSRSHATGSRI